MTRIGGLVVIAGASLLAGTVQVRACAKEAPVVDDGERARTPPTPAASATASPRGDRPDRVPERVARARPPIEPRPTVPSAVDLAEAKQAWQEAISKDMFDNLTVFIEECHDLAGVDRREDGEISLDLQIIGEPSKGVTVVDVDVRMTSADQALKECIAASALDVQVSTVTPPLWYEDHWRLSVTTTSGRRAYTWAGEPIYYE